jgi:hypothetical protein
MDQAPTWRALLRDTYLTVDRRTLGMARIAIGFLLIMDLFRRTPDWLAMFSTAGVLPSPLFLARPQSDGFSVFAAFNTPGELWFLWALGLIAFTCLLVGYRTRAAQIVSLVYVTSMNGRVLLIENGGYVVQNLLLLWTCFMPLGDRFSVDALLASFRRERERTADELNDRSRLLEPQRVSPHVTLAMAAVLLQLSAVYFFNVVHKTGPAWADGTAVHYVLHNDRMITPLLASTRDHLPLWLVQVLTRGTLAIEAGLVLLLLSPLARVWARRGVFFGMNALHLGFGTSFTLGPFAWSCCTFATLMVCREDWELLERVMRRPARARTVVYDPRSGAALFACRLLKRLDRFELLAFRAAPGGEARSGDGVDGQQSVFHTVAASGARASGARALADVTAALPLGPAIAWLFVLPGVRHAIDGLAAAASRLRLGAWIGWRSAGDPSGPGPARSASAARAGGRALAVVREALVLVMLAAAIDQACVELWVAKPLRLPQPTAMRLLSHKMRFLQGWFMFSPNPVMDDGTIVVDAMTVDGRHIDPFTLRAPDFDLASARSLRLNQIWGDYFNRIRLQGNSPYRDAMKDYLLRLPERTNHPSDALVSGDVYWIQDINPPLGRTTPTRFEKIKLFSFQGAPPRLATRDGGGS